MTDTMTLEQVARKVVTQLRNVQHAYGGIADIANDLDAAIKSHDAAARFGDETSETHYLPQPQTTQPTAQPIDIAAVREVIKSIDLRAETCLDPQCKTWANKLEVACRAALKSRDAAVPVGRLNIRRFRGSDAMVNHDFDYFGDLPDGTYSLYTAPPAQPADSGREAFERWCERRGIATSPEHRTYEYQQAYEDWQAAMRYRDEQEKGDDNSV